MSKEVVMRPAGVHSDVSFDQYSFPFENIVFEDGPTNSLAYVGAIKCLEEAGIWSRIQRLGGAGSGAVVATLLSVGFNSKQLKQFFQTDLRTLTQDHCCGMCCIGSNMKSSFGWNSDKNIEKWLGGKLKEVAGKPNITFLEIYEKFGKELCVIVTNVSRGVVEYCHVKTTPDLAVTEAVRMSLASPGLFSPVKTQRNGFEQYFATGGILCAYPIHCFDGWWLSLRSDDSFINRLSLASDLLHIDDVDRFGIVSSKTLGFITYDETSSNVWTCQIEERNKLVKKPILPNSKLATKWSATHKACKSSDERYASYTAAARKFLELYTSHLTADMKKFIGKQNLETALNKNLVSAEELKVVFGASTADQIWKEMKPKKKEQTLNGQDFVSYIERKCLALQAEFQRGRCNDIKSVTDYLEAVQLTLITNSRRAKAVAGRSHDVERTVGINLHHISGTRNQPLELDDCAFLVECGHQATRLYLEQYINKSLAPMKDGPNRRSFIRDDLPTYIDDEVSEIIDERDYMENLVGRVL